MLDPSSNNDLRVCPQCGFHPFDDNSTTFLNTDSESLPAQVQTLLHNNESPPDHESAIEIQQLLDEAERVSSDLESQIERMQASIVHLTARRERITANIQAYRTVLHPIRRLPREIVLVIFEWCVSVSSIEPESVVTDDPRLKLPGLRVVSSLSSKPPWTLGHISKHWRVISLSSPTLWTSVSIFLRTQSPTAALQRRAELAQVSLLSIYLSRSRDFPLSVYVNSLHSTSPLLSMLWAQSYRWRNSVLYLPVESLRELSFSVKGNLPLLRNLLISITREPLAVTQAQQHWENVIDNNVVIDAFQFTPELKCLAISQIPNFPKLFTIPWAQLNRFECNLKSEAWQRCDNNMNLDIMQRASNIRMAMFRCSYISEQRLSCTPIRHMHLHTLNLFSVLDSNPSIPHVGQYLDNITLPALRQLSIRTQRREIDASSAVLRLLERSESTSLRVVLLNDMPMSLQSTRRLFTLIPTVEHLGFSGVTDDMVRVLYRRTGSSDSEYSDTEAASEAVLPRLRRLSLYGVESLTVNQRLLLGMIESRRSRPELVRISDPDSSDDIARLERMELSRKFNFSDFDAIYSLETLLADGFVLDQR